MRWDRLTRAATQGPDARRCRSCAQHLRRYHLSEFLVTERRAEGARIGERACSSAFGD
jgi:hypothetical protein